MLRLRLFPQLQKRCEIAVILMFVAVDVFDVFSGAFFDSLEEVLFPNSLKVVGQTVTTRSPPITVNAIKFVEAGSHGA